MRTVNQLARAAGISIRTLHHYDAIGLLRPAETGSNGYRYYGHAELLKLQQILFYRELGLPLSQIRSILDEPGFDPVAALTAQRAALVERAERYATLIVTIDRTIDSLRKDYVMEDEHYYAGIGPETLERWDREARERWGAAIVDAARGKVRTLGKDRTAAIQTELAELREGFRRLFTEGAAPESEEVQALTARHYAWVSHSWVPDAASFKGLGELYRDDPEFRATYDGEDHPGTAAFIAQAMAIFADREL